jgi:hypothetical protein
MHCPVPPPLVSPVLVAAVLEPLVSEVDAVVVGSVPEPLSSPEHARPRVTRAEAAMIRQ